MADTQSNLNTQSSDTQEDRPRRVSSVGFDAKLAPTCMMWSMIIAIGFIILTAVIWGIQHFGSIFS